MDQEAPKRSLSARIRLASIRFGFYGTLFGFLISFSNCISSVVNQVNAFRFHGTTGTRISSLSLLLPGIFGWMIGTAIGATVGLVNRSGVEPSKPLKSKFFIMGGAFLGLHPGLPLGFAWIDDVFDSLNYGWRILLPKLVYLYILPVIFIGCLGALWGHWVATRSNCKGFNPPNQN